ncbi:MAG: hypothetical protein NZ890_09540 [Myxococcota bacterium]|nr:hypothetical protein [Myxococcota bacterium]
MPMNPKPSIAVRTLLLVCGLGLMHCSAPPVRKAVIVRLQPPADARVAIASIKAVGTLDGKPSTSGPQIFSGEMVPFTLLLPPESSGRFVVEIEARSSDLLQVATGEGEVLIGEPDQYELTIPLRRAVCRKPGWCFDDPASRSLALRAMWGRSAQDVWAVGDLGTVLHYNGFCWAVVPTEVTEDLRAVWGSAQGELWYAGAKGTLVRHQPGPLRRFGGTPQTLFALWGSGAGDVWAAGEGGTLLRYQDGQWRQERIGLSVVLRALWGSGPGDVWAAGDKGTLLRYQGGQWRQEQIGVAVALYALWGSGAEDVWAAGEGGGLVRWNGRQWESTRVGSATLFGLWGSSGGPVWAVGLQGTILWRDGGSFTVVHMGPPPQMR